MKTKTADITTPYRIYGPDGRLELTSDERCRYPPSTELSLINAKHTIMLGTRKVTKKEVMALLAEGKGTGANENPRNRPRK